jgi:hypothetical protein
MAGGLILIVIGAIILAAAPFISKMVSTVDRLNPELKDMSDDEYAEIIKRNTLVDRIAGAVLIAMGLVFLAIVRFGGYA